MTELVVMRVNEITVSIGWGRAKVSSSPVGDVLYAIKPHDNHIETQEDGTQTFTVDGIRHIIKGLQLTLVVDRDDF